MAGTGRRWRTRSRHIGFFKRLTGDAHLDHQVSDLCFGHPPTRGRVFEPHWRASAADPGFPLAAVRPDAATTVLDPRTGEATN
jgi:hypothetical protein